MARLKEYDRDDVLDKAVRLFWQKGYKACSVSDIVRVTGLNTASMYKEFGDKDGLFEEALTHYRTHIIGPRFQTLTDHPDLTGVEMFLDSVVTGAIKNDYKGCLMMNHLAQQPSITPQAARMIDDFCNAMETLLATALDNARIRGQISAHHDPGALASYIMCYVHGLVLYGRHQDRKTAIPQLHDMILETLKT